MVRCSGLMPKVRDARGLVVDGDRRFRGLSRILVCRMHVTVGRDCRPPVVLIRVVAEKLNFSN